MNVAKDYNSATDISYNRQSGMRASAYEHLIPEKLFTDQTQPNAPQAISAVKALAIAASQGQKIFTITQANQDILLPQINVDPDVMTEMQNALSIGKEVTVHQSPITQSGWTGTGYIITDPVTGAGAYKISGGANGSYLLGALGGLFASLGIFMLTFAFSEILILSISSGILLAVLGSFLAMSWLIAAEILDDGCFTNGFITFFGFANVAVGIKYTLLGSVFSIISGLLSTTLTNVTPVPKCG
jgi:hypothetical protein